MTAVHPWRTRLRRIAWALLIWLALVGLPSIPVVRAVLSAPLRAHDPEARGEVAYVLAAGLPFMRERLVAASDLFHLGRVERVVLAHDRRRSNFHFASQTSWTSEQWAVHMLVSMDVPKDRIDLIEIHNGLLDTLEEARALRSARPELRRVVLVSSPSHLRRARLAFRRAWSDDLQVDVYQAQGPIYSVEVFHPIWWEYLKLAVYFVLA